MNLVRMWNTLPIYWLTVRALKRFEACQYADPAIATKSWSTQVLDKLRLEVTFKGEVDPRPGVLFVGNHISYLDIPVLFSTIPQVSFLAKSEVGHWPIFGKAARAIGTVFVNRVSPTSRMAARESLGRALSEGRRVCIFPSGTTSMIETDSWRIGAFKLAAERGFSVQAFRIQYSHLRDCAYIEDDFLPTHLAKLTGHKKIECQIEVRESMIIRDPLGDCEKLNRWVRREGESMTEMAAGDSCHPMNL